jgi:hypothetical protein
MIIDVTSSRIIPVSQDVGFGSRASIFPDQNVLDIFCLLPKTTRHLKVVRESDTAFV